MSFSLERCAIPKVWCGKKEMPKKSSDPTVKYVKAGSPYECLTVGIGTGMRIERKKNLPEDSLEQIKFIGPTYEERFRKEGIKNIKGLVSKMKKLSTLEQEKYLKKILKKGNYLDRRAYNSILIFLFREKISKLPQCIKL